MTREAYESRSVDRMERMGLLQGHPADPDSPVQAGRWAAWALPASLVLAVGLYLLASHAPPSRVDHPPAAPAAPAAPRPVARPPSMISRRPRLGLSVTRPIRRPLAPRLPRVAATTTSAPPSRPDADARPGGASGRWWVDQAFQLRAAKAPQGGFLPILVRAAAAVLEEQDRDRAKALVELFHRGLTGLDAPCWQVLRARTTYTALVGLAGEAPRDPGSFGLPLCAP